MNHGICTPDGIKINGYYPGPITEIEPLESGDYKVYFNNGEYIVVPAKKSKDIKDVSETSDGNIELNLIMENSNSQINTRTAKIPFQYVVDDMENAENTNTDMEIEVINQDFIIQDGGSIISNIDLMMNQNSYQNTNLNIMNEIQSNGERESEDYSVIMYIVKKGDTLWNIAKEFGSTVEDIVRVNGIEDENKISVGQKIFVPRFVKTGI